MTKYTQRQLREMVKEGIAEDITYGNNDTRREIEEKEGNENVKQKEVSTKV